MTQEHRAKRSTSKLSMRQESSRKLKRLTEGRYEGRRLWKANTEMLALVEDVGGHDGSVVFLDDGKATSRS